ncbi:MAG TPA: c-type cytochrome [Xanthobacteraceae bacterium]|nr:c-type cytochrome [Xanthobacteraceae bacterium]
MATSAQDAAKNAVPPPDFQAKVQYCKTCHGLSGQGFHGAIPIPRLAGQQPEYFENQLGAFLERRRENKFMFGVVHALTPQMIAALSAHFHDLDAKPVGGAPKDLVPAGKKLYEEGAGAEVPACGTCHGADAKGNGPFPRLAGQLDDYVFNKLVNWSKERGQDPAKPDTSAIMEPIAHGLSQQQVKAVAAYLNYLE